jgi:hypothetical protein
MLVTKPPQIDPTEVPARGLGSFMLAARPGLYILLLLAVGVGVGARSFRKDSIFSCRASGYASDRYIAYCGGKNYGDYEHGAFWFNLEPAATAAAANSRVMFLGNSRMQFAFSSKATADWFSSLSESYYLLGFSAFGNYTFEAPLLRKLRPRAKVYVINIDSFFDSAESPPAKIVMQDAAAQSRYEQKRQWQKIHKAICASSEIVCGHGFALFRSRSSGAWIMSGLQYKMDPVSVSYDEGVDQDMLASYTVRGNEFLPSLSADRACTILTIVPTVKTTVGTAKAIAASLGLNLVAPTPAGLITFDGSHLQPESAQRWSAAFLEEAGPQIRKCLDQ